MGTQDLVAARAVAPLTVIVEYAAPLLALGGVLVAWKGRVEPAEEDDGRAAAAALGMSAPEPVPVEPFPGAHDRTSTSARRSARRRPRYPSRDRE